MKKIILILVISVFSSCINREREIYQIEETLIDGSIDTVLVDVRYNKDLRKLEHTFIESDMFNESGINTLYSLAEAHPLWLMYGDTLTQLKPKLIEFSKIAGNYTDPLGAKLIGNSIVFNRSEVVNYNVGKIKSFRILSKNNIAQKDINLDQKLIDFINNPNVTAQEIDNVPYVSTKASINIVNARPIKSSYDLNKVPYVSDEAVRRLRIYAENYGK